MADFLTLPTELRLQIYHYVYQNATISFLGIPTTHPTALFKTCRLISFEAQPIFWSHATFDLVHFRNIEYHIPDSRWRRRATSLRLELGQLGRCNPGLLAKHASLQHDAYNTRGEFLPPMLRDSTGVDGEAPAGSLRRVRSVHDIGPDTARMLWGYGKIRRWLPAGVEEFEVELRVRGKKQKKKLEETAKRLDKWLRIVFLDGEGGKDRVVFRVENGDAVMDAELRELLKG